VLNSKKMHTTPLTKMNDRLKPPGMSDVGFGGSSKQPMDQNPYAQTVSDLKKDLHDSMSRSQELNLKVARDVVKESHIAAEDFGRRPSQQHHNLTGDQIIGRFFETRTSLWNDVATTHDRRRKKGPGGGSVSHADQPRSRRTACAAPLCLRFLHVGL